jgi:cation transport ATPase
VIALLAMAGAVLLGEYLAGAVIALMLASGRALEAHAAGRAGRELEALLARTPRTAHRYERGELAAIPVGQVLARDRLLVMQGEVIPVDGALEADHAVLDESALTGEARPVERTRGDPVRSGAVNTGPLSTCASRPPPRRAPTRASCGWWSRPSPARRRSSAWPTATRWRSCR